jgi:alanine or glycine:cation symporter, AGCS family
VRQAMVSMTQTFVDTVVMLTLTGLMIVATDAWKAEGVAGPTMTSLAIATGFARISPALAPWGSYVVAVGVVFFAFCTILGWSYYGERCMEFLFGRGAVQPYRVVFLLFAFVGAVLELDLVWVLSDTANGLMALPNLLGLLVLSPVVVRESWKYFANPEWRKAEAPYVE